jgi:hypothetical protein
LGEILDDEELRTRLGRRSLELIEEWGLPETADGIEAAARAAAARSDQDR